jgi:flagellar protein FlaJ
MSYSESSHKRSKKGSSDSETISFDLLYQLSYMSAISAAGIPRSQIFELASQLPCSTSKYISEIHLYSQKMRYDYAVASRMVGESSKNEAVKSLLLRLSSSLGSGEKEANFLEQEANIQAEAFKNDYERRVESLRKWTEAYAALVVSAALIVMVAAISMLIYPVAIGYIGALIAITIATGIIGAWMVYRVSPKEIRIHWPDPYCAARAKVRRLEYVFLSLAGISVIGMLIAGVNLAWILVVTSILLLPIGVASVLFERKVSKKDRDISTFLRSLGNLTSAIGITISQAVGRLDLRSTSALIPDVRRLRARLASRLKTDLCWQRFALETGSEVIYRSVRMFLDATRLGGDPEVVGERSSLLARSLEFLRAKRGQVSSSFSWLALGIHAAIVGLLVFVMQVITAFSIIVEDVYTEAVADAPNRALEIFSFNFGNVYLLNTLVLPCLLVLAASTAFAANASDGGTRQRLYFYLALTFGLSGAALLTVPVITNMIFTSVSVT